MTLCRKCRFGTVVEMRTGTILSYCHEMLYKGTSKIPVDNCSSFEDKRFVDKYELEKIAWELKLNSSGKITGFSPPVKKDV